MIYVRLAGGLGNQLYQLAAASLLSQTFYMPICVVPLIDGLNLYDEPREPDSLELLQTTTWLLSPTTPSSFIWRFLSLKTRAGRWLPFLGISDRNFWEAVKQGAYSPKLLDGYFQNGWTHESFARATSHMAARQISKIAAARIDSDEVIVHIRGGDFLRLIQFQVVNADYYVRAARQAMFRGLKRFAIISDDPPFSILICDEMRRQIPGIEIRIISRGVTALEDFDTIRAASARIIGNSTFAWWASVFGACDTPTWSPTRFTRDCRRDFFLTNELKVE